MTRHGPRNLLAILIAAGLVALGTAPAVQVGAAAREQASLPAAAPAPPQLGPPGCPWPAVSGRRLLDRQLGSVSFTHARVYDIVANLAEEHGVPLSFIEASPDEKLTITLPRCTLRRLLDQVATAAPGYRYGFFGPHLVLYSSDPKWQARVGDLKLGPGSRYEVSRALVKELRRQVPAQVRLSTWLYGSLDSFLYKDEVAVAGPASVIELFAQLLGSRVSATFMVVTTGESSRESLALGWARLLKSLEVTASTTTLRQRDERVQLQVSGILPDGTRQELTAARCGTTYRSVDEKVLAVGADGQVTAVGRGQASVVVTHDGTTKPILFRVTLGSAP
jgi:hypothetical protein